MAKHAELEPIILSPGQRKEIPLCHLPQARDSDNFPINTPLTLLWCISSTSNQYGSGETAEALQSQRRHSAGIAVSNCCYWNDPAKSIYHSLYHIKCERVYIYTRVCVCIAFSIFAKYIHKVLLLWVSTRCQEYLNSVTTFSPVFTHCPLCITHCPLCISSSPNYQKGQGFYFSNFEQEKLLLFFEFWRERRLFFL